MIAIWVNKQQTKVDPTVAVTSALTDKEGVQKFFRMIHLSDSTYHI